MDNIEKILGTITGILALYSFIQQGKTIQKKIIQTFIIIFVGSSVIFIFKKLEVVAPNQKDSLNKESAPIIDITPQPNNDHPRKPSPTKKKMPEKDESLGVLGSGVAVSKKNDMPSLVFIDSEGNVYYRCNEFMTFTPLGEYALGETVIRSSEGKELIIRDVKRQKIKIIRIEYQNDSLIDNENDNIGSITVDVSENNSELFEITSESKIQSKIVEIQKENDYKKDMKRIIFSGDWRIDQGVIPTKISDSIIYTTRDYAKQQLTDEEKREIIKRRSELSRMKKSQRVNRNRPVWYTPTYKNH